MLYNYSEICLIHKRLETIASNAFEKLGGAHIEGHWLKGDPSIRLILYQFTFFSQFCSKDDTYPWIYAKIEKNATLTPSTGASDSELNVEIQSADCSFSGLPHFIP